MTLHHHPPGSPSRLLHGRTPERGVVILMMALSLVAVAVVAALVIDGSQAYPQRRSMQNAADSSALAGARALDKVKFGGQAWTTVASTVTSVATNNSAESNVCTIITGTGTDLGSCDTQAVVLSALAAGVRVRASDVRSTAFGQFAGKPTVTASASSAATIQTLVGTKVPFAICGNPAKGGYPILNADGTINVQAAIAMGTIDIQSSQVPTCGAGSAFKGKIEDNGEVLVPGWVEADNGNGYEQDIEVTVLNAKACPTGGPFTGCDMLVPIADEGAGNGSAIYLHGVAWAVFHIVGDGLGNPKYQGYFRAEVPYVSGGATSTQVPTSAQTPRAIRLID